MLKIYFIYKVAGKKSRVQPETLKSVSEMGEWYKRGVKQVFVDTDKL
jgi:hypothetical protein